MVYRLSAPSGTREPGYWDVIRVVDEPERYKLYMCSFCTYLALDMLLYYYDVPPVLRGVLQRLDIGLYDSVLRRAKTHCTLVTRVTMGSEPRG